MISTDDDFRAIANPVDRERATHDAIESAQVAIAVYARVRAEAIREIYAREGTWAKVGRIIGCSAQNAHRLANP